MTRKTLLVTLFFISGATFLSVHGSSEALVWQGMTVSVGWNGIPSPYGVGYDPASRRLSVANDPLGEDASLIST